MQRAAPRLVLEEYDAPPSVTVYYVAMSNASLDAGHSLEEAEMDKDTVAQPIQGTEQRAKSTVLRLYVKVSVFDRQSRKKDGNGLNS